MAVSTTSFCSTAGVVASAGAGSLASATGMGAAPASASAVFGEHAAAVKAASSATERTVRFIGISWVVG